MTFQLTDYTRLEKIGEGTYGVVYKCKNECNKELVAVKKIRSDNDEDGISSTTLREISTLKELSHPNIVKLKQTMIESGKIYLVFEFLTMDLRRYLDAQESQLEPLVVKSFMYQMMQGLLFCHVRRVIHRDLKPQNLLIDTDKMILKIGDFGLARTFGAPVKPLTHEVVTLWYRAPEVLLNCKRYSCALDVWSVGCIFAEIATKKPLFQGDSEIDQLFCIFKLLGTPTGENWPGVDKLSGWKNIFPTWNFKLRTEFIYDMPNNALDLLEKMLSYNPISRLNIRDSLLHEYFEDFDKCSVPARDEEVRCSPLNVVKHYRHDRNVLTAHNSDL